MKRSLLAVLILTLPLFAFAQIEQRGVAVLINSSHSPLSGVEVIAAKSIPTVSDSDGCFNLYFTDAADGEFLMLTIEKTGYEVVNIKEIRNWTLSTEVMHRIIMCKEGYLDESIGKYYEIGVPIYKNRYYEKRAELDAMRKSNKIKDNEYRNELKRISKEREKSMEALSFYADKFARINKDDLNELDAKAIGLLEAGDVDGAIKVYEDAQLLEKFMQKIETRDSAYIIANELKSAVETLQKTYMKLGDSVSIKKADSIQLEINKLDK